MQRKGGHATLRMLFIAETVADSACNLFSALPSEKASLLLITHQMVLIYVDQASGKKLKEREKAAGDLKGSREAQSIAVMLHRRAGSL